MHVHLLAALTEPQRPHVIVSTWQRQAQLEEELQAAKQAAHAQAAAHASALAKHKAKACDQIEQQAAQTKVEMASLTAQVTSAVSTYLHVV